MGTLRLAAAQGEAADSPVSEAPDVTEHEGQCSVTARGEIL